MTHLTDRALNGFTTLEAPERFKSWELSISIDTTDKTNFVLSILIFVEILLPCKMLNNEVLIMSSHCCKEHKGDLTDEQSEQRNARRRANYRKKVGDGTIDLEEKKSEIARMARATPKNHE